MSLHDARRFVIKMREDRNFRSRAVQTDSRENLSVFLQGEGMVFDKKELVAAMAECMEQMESCACC